MHSRLRWLVLVMVFVATGLSFLDRQVLSVVILKIQTEFGITDVQYGIVNTGFLVGYAIMFTIAGRLIDGVGSRLGLAASVGLWSVANSLHGVVGNFHQLVGARFLLGLGEGGCFPGAVKTVNEWFKPGEHALANGIAIGGAAIGAVVAPPLTIFLVSGFGWRQAFVIPGLIGIVWVLAWLIIPRQKDTTFNLTPTSAVIPILTLLKNKNALTFILIRFMLDPVVYFVMFWVPKYLGEERHVSFERIGELFWIPFLALGISNIIGGWLSDVLIAKNFSVSRARRTVMGIAAAITITSPFIVMVSTAEIAVALMALFMFAHGFWITNYITSISDVFGNRGTATVVGLSGTAGAISSLIVNPFIGLVVQNFSYGPLWLATGVLYPVAFIIFISIVKTKSA